MDVKKMVSRQWFALAAPIMLLGILMTGITGCKNDESADANGDGEEINQTEGNDTPEGNDHTDDHGHDDHGHDDHGHSHDHGTHGPVLEGHLIDLVSAEGEMLYAEWNHDDDAQSITVALLNDSESEAVSKPGASVVIDTLFEGEKEVFYLEELPASDGVLADSQYQIISDNLTAMIDFEDVVSTLKISHEGVEYSAVINHDHSDCDHGHSHD